MCIRDSTNIDVNFLKQNTSYRSCDENNATIRLFWKVLTSFSQDERSQYLRFVWGRSRLPLRVEDFDSKHEIELMDYGSNADKRLPLSHTCYFRLDLPKYSSFDIMAEKLRYAIKNCQAIDTDNTGVQVWDEAEMGDVEQSIHIHKTQHTNSWIA
eukprot:TRINITY_DN6279_c0_g1_i9.p2 TRINITY_DN6279_c0_g1~~TRINITY_DN6279_c0_g1_i9.p2  ORF type:complete len:155 (-),score=34.08 TRINITY_DN6279_c0_g1_i9:168-632(-)